MSLGITFGPHGGDEIYGGIDLHSNNSVVVMIDESDHVVGQKRLPNDLTKIVGFLARWKDELAGVAVESTYNWYWLVEQCVATKALAHKLARACYHILKEGKPFDVTRCFA